MCTVSQHLEHVEGVTAQGIALLPAEVRSGITALAVAAHQFDDRDLRAAAKAYTAQEARIKQQVDALGTSPALAQARNQKQAAAPASRHHSICICL